MLPAEMDFGGQGGAGQIKFTFTRIQNYFSPQSMYRELARAREISQVTQQGSLTLQETGKHIKRAFELHNLQSDSWYDTKIDHLQVFLKQYFDIIPLSSNYQLLWNLVVLLVIYYSFLVNIFSILITDNIDSSKTYDNKYHQTNNYMMLVVMVLDILLVRWRVEQVAQLQNRRNHNMVSRTYFTYYFWIDLLVIIVVIMDIFDVPYSFWKLVIYLKIFIFNDIKEQIEVAIYGHTAYELAFTAARLLAFIAFWSFFFASFYVTIELIYLKERGYYYDNGFLWIISHPSLRYINIYEHFEWYVWFQYALFFVMQMVRGAGMGVPSPRCPPSMLWYCVCNVTMTVMFWYFTDKFMSFINEHVDEDQLLHEIVHLKEVEKVKYFQQGYYQKYQIFLRIDASAQIEATRLEDKLKAMFPETLRREFNFSMKQHFLLRFQLFKTIVSHSFTEELFKRELAQIIQSRIVYRGENLYVRNQLQPERLYLSQKRIFILSNNDLNYAEELPQWSFAGIREFYIEQKPLFNVFVKNIAHIEYIQKSKFIAVVKLFPMMYEGFRERIDSICIEREDTESIELKCWHCQEYHLSEDCDRIARDKELLMNRLKLRKLNMHFQRNPTTSMLSENIPFFRKMIESQKVQVGKFRRPPLEIDVYKRRGFSYLEYNIQGIQFDRKVAPEPMYQSQVLKYNRSNKRLTSLKNDQPFQAILKEGSRKELGRREGSNKNTIDSRKQTRKESKKEIKPMQSQMYRVNRSAHYLIDSNNSVDHPDK